MENLYEYHMKNLIHKIKDAQGNPENLLKSGARNDLFYLEGLSRLDSVYNRKMKKWLEKFKKREDLLGKLDFYLWVSEEIKKKKMPHLQKKLLIKDAQEKLKSIKKDCIKYFFKKFAFEKWTEKLNKKLKKFELNHNQKHLSKIKSSIINEMNELHRFLEDRNYTFKYMEEDVHEFRRKIRWFSIYAWALCGKIELKSRKVFSIRQKQRWITPDLLKNPFVKLPKIRGGYKLYYNKEIFIALSGIIQQVGEWKDESLLNEHMDKILKNKINSRTIQDNILIKVNDVLKNYLLDQLFLKKLVYF